MGSNLRRRGGVYWFRRRVPDALKARVERNEINRSLRTKCAKTARARARQAWLATEAMFRGMTLNPSLAASQAKLLIDALLEEPLRASRTADDLVDDLVCQSARKKDPLLEWAPEVGQVGTKDLTWKPGFRRMKAHGQAPIPQHRVQATGCAGVPGW
jgi:hypothetical protein